MFGYLMPQVSELRVREVELYRAYYCGVCRALGAECGALCRFLLRYDLAALALARDAVEPGEPEWVKGRCPFNPLRRIGFIRSEAVTYAARLHLLLWIGKAQDDVMDEGKPTARILSQILEKPVKRAGMEAFRPAMEGMLDAQRRLEREGADPDGAAEPFSRFLGQIFSEGAAGAEPMHYLGYNIGKWIYWIDALDDFEKDIKRGNYNPWAQVEPDREAAAKRAMVGLGQCAKGARMALDVMHIHRNEGILLNIADHGMPAMAQSIAKGGERHAGPLRGIGREAYR